MEITKEISVKINPNELRKIIMDYLKKEKGLTITDVHFVVGVHENPTDCPSHELDEVRCVGTEEPKKKKTCTHCGGSGDVRTESRGMTGYDSCPYCNGTGEK